MERFTLSGKQVAGLHKQGRTAVARTQQHVQEGQVAIGSSVLATIILGRIHVPNYQCQDAQCSKMVPDLQDQYISGFDNAALKAQNMPDWLWQQFCLAHVE